MKTLRNLLIFLLTAVLLIGLVTVTASATTSSDTDDGFEYDSMFSEGGARVYLILMGVIFGIILPAVPLTIFLLKLVRKRAECEVIDYIIIGLSTLWLAVGITIFVLIL